MASARDLSFKFGGMSSEEMFALYSFHETRPVMMPATPTTTSGTTSGTPTTTDTVTPTPRAHETTNATSTRPNAPSVFVVLQHSESAGRSALLPQSKILGIFTTEEQAKFHLQLQKVHRKIPLIRDKTAPGSILDFSKAFWCTSTGEDPDEWGFRYQSEAGEEFVVWIEQHDVSN